MEKKHKKLQKLRSEIDQIDKKIIENLGKRLQIAKKIGMFKKKNHIDIKSKEREMQILEVLVNEAKKKNLDKSLILKIYRIIFDHSRRNQEGSTSFDKKGKI